MKSKFFYYMEWAHTTWLGLLHQYKYSRVWDERLNILIDTHGDMATKEKHKIKLGHVYVWTSNRFYSFGNPYAINEKNIPYDCKFRPSIKTMIKLAMLVDSLSEPEKTPEQKLIKLLDGVNDLTPPAIDV